MADLPTLKVDGGVSADPVGAVTAPGDVGLGKLANSADRFGAALQETADRADTAKGERDAADASTAGTAPLNDATTYGHAYNQVMTRKLGLERQAALTESMAQAAAKYPDNPIALGQALDATKAGFAKTGFPQLDATFDGEFAVQRASHMAQAFQNARSSLAQQASANMEQGFVQQGAKLDQLAANAPFTPDGAKLVAQGYQQAVASNIHDGPQGEFTAGGITFAADPTRTGLLSPEQIQAQMKAHLDGARVTWITSRQAALPDQAGQQKFADDVRAKWSAGDPMLAGLDPNVAEKLFDQLDSLADKTGRDARASAEASGQSAKRALEAFGYGGDADLDQALDDARASGDAGLVAQVQNVRRNASAYRGAQAEAENRRVAALTFSGLPSAVDGSTLPQMVQAVIGAESGGRPGLTSPKGALGLMQLMPGTARDAAKRLGLADVAALPDAALQQRLLTDRQLNLTLGTEHLRYLSQEFGGNPTLALAAYNAGDGAVRKWLADPAIGDPRSGRITDAEFAARIPYKETRGYVAQISAAIGSGRAQVAVAASAPTTTSPEIVSDPLRWAMGDKTRPPRGTVPPLDLAAPFSGDPGRVTAWAQSLRQRLALSTTINRDAGLVNPPRSMTDAEVASVRDALKFDPGRGGQLANALIGALGPTAARGVLAEVGQNTGDAATSLHLAELHTAGNGGFASDAANGLRLQAAGAKAVPYDKNRGEETFDQAAAKMAPAFANAPDVLVSARNVAEAARVNDMSRGINRPAAWYLQSAVGGAQNGVSHFGGVVQVNGAPTLLPTWLEAGHVAQTLTAVGDRLAGANAGPVFANGQPMRGRDLAGLRPIYRSDGSYSFVQPRTGRLVADRTGAPFRLDLDAQRPFIAATVDGSTRRQAQ